jgi:hypothetical protein
MQLPFTKEQFFDLFAAYNEALWPALIALWIASALTMPFQRSFFLLLSSAGIAAFLLPGRRTALGSCWLDFARH